jgi:hypothetical protein
MPKRKATAATEEKSEKKRSLNAKDYDYLSKLVIADLRTMKIGAPGYKEANQLYQFLREKAKKEDTPKGSGQKFYPKWKCLDCEEIHEKVESKRLCIGCGSDKVQKEVFTEA